MAETVTPNNKPSVVRTRQAKFSEGEYMASGELNGEGVYKHSAVKYDIESYGNSLINQGATDVTFWRKYTDTTTNRPMYREDSSWLTGPKKQSVAKTIDRKAKDMADNISASMKEVSKAISSGSFNDEMGMEVYEECQRLFRHLHISGPSSFGEHKTHAASAAK